MYLRFFLSLLQGICLIPTIGGSLYGILCSLGVLRFNTRKQARVRQSFSQWPPVTILKPVCGLEKNQRENLRSACVQDYPAFQVIFSAQDFHDPAIPLLREIEKEFGTERVSVVVENRRAGPNGKINNLLGGISRARYDVLVVSDSDACLRPDYLKAIVAPLADPEVGCVCTLYKAICADSWFEKMELLTFNADFIPSVIFAYVSGASNFCLGPSMAFRRATLEEMGGLETLADYLVEDYEIGRRLWTSGKKVAISRHFIDIVIDLKNPSQWWDHQIYWDQNTRAARPIGFFASILVRAVPFALLFAILRGGDWVGLYTLTGTLCLRLATAGLMMGWGFRDREGLRCLAFLPFRDIAAIGTWFLAFIRRTVVWRGVKFSVTRDGRLTPLKP